MPSESPRWRSISLLWAPDWSQNQVRSLTGLATQAPLIFPNSNGTLEKYFFRERRNHTKLQNACVWFLVTVSSHGQCGKRHEQHLHLLERLLPFQLVCGCFLSFPSIMKVRMKGNLISTGYLILNLVCSSLFSSSVYTFNKWNEY